MIRSWKAYLGIVAVGIVSFLVVFFGPDKNYIQEFAAIPLVGALVAALFVLLRDHAAYERELALQDKKNSFVIGASSHMANVAFDKHVEFAEAYISEAQETLRTLFVEGPCEQALEHATSLYGVQKQYRAWLTTDIEETLDEFESRLRRLGAAAKFEKNATSAQQVKRLDEMYEEFAGLINMDEWEGKEVTDENAVMTLIGWIRTVLGTEELTKLRGEIISRAAEEVTKGHSNG